MDLLQGIIGILKTIGISVAGITFVVLMLKIATNPEEKVKYLKLTKHLLIATIFITISLSLIDIPKQYYGDKVEIVDSIKREATIEDLKDKDCQGRETINIDGKWYVVTDTGRKIAGLTEGDSLDDVSIVGVYSEGKVVNNVSFLRRFGDCQGFTKGLFAEIKYYRDQDGLIFPRDYTYSQYQNFKASQNENKEERRRLKYE